MASAAGSAFVSCGTGPARPGSRSIWRLKYTMTGYSSGYPFVQRAVRLAAVKFASDTIALAEFSDYTNAVSGTGPSAGTASWVDVSEPSSGASRLTVGCRRRQR